MQSKSYFLPRIHKGQNDVIEFSGMPSATYLL